MTGERGDHRRADVVILTAIPLEYQAVLQVDAGAVPGSSWEVDEKGPAGLPVAFRAFEGKGRDLHVAVTLAADMGAVSATNYLLPLVDRYRPAVVAMCGVCAGRPGKTNLGDVVAAERLYFHDTGKQLPDGVQQDLTTYNLRPDWKVALEQFDFAGRFQEQAWWTGRPVPYVWQENWVLYKLKEGVKNPGAEPDCDRCCPSWTRVIEALWKSEDLEPGKLVLTARGKERIEKELILHRGGLPDLSPVGKSLPFRVHVTSMASGSKVIEDQECWTFISEHMRRTLGLDMEAAALGALAHAWQTRGAQRLDALVMKGVMDFANHGRDDHFKEYAARAAAECLIAFLREKIELESQPGQDDLLSSGTASLPKNPPPSALLSARHAVVPWERGRDEVVEELIRWCEDGPRAAVRLIYAAGGSGKTRLAIELTQRMRSGQWSAGFVDRRVREDWLQRLWGSGRSILAVFDYAESHVGLGEALRQALRFKETLGDEPGRRLRILLLSRNCDDWWASLRQSDGGLGSWLTETPPLELKPLVMDQHSREDVFRRAREALAANRGVDAGARPLPSLADPRFERVLFIHMAALSSLEDEAVDPATLMDDILDHEERCWAVGALSDATGANLRSQARQLVAAATLRGGIAGSTEASTVAKRLFGAGSPETETMLRQLHRVYEDARALFLPPLEPDSLGEAMVLRVAGPKLSEDVVDADWIDRVFPDGDDGQALAKGFEVLGRCSVVQEPRRSQDGVHQARRWVGRMLATNVLAKRAVVAFNAARAVGTRSAFSPLGEILARQLEVAGNSAIAMELQGAAWPGRSLSLAPVSAWMHQCLLRQAGEAERRAQLLHSYAVDLSTLGRREAALEATLEAVKIRRELAEARPGIFRTHLAGSLNNLGNRYSELGQREKALEATREAAEIYRRLAEARPEAFLPDFAGSLNNLGARYSELGQRDKALEATREAAEIDRRLADAHPDAFLHYLAGSLNNLGARYSELGQRERALEATREAAEIRRKLADAYPDAFLPDLGMSLNNLGAMCSELGQREKALDATREAAQIYRRLADARPAAFLPDLGMSLNNLGARYSELGQRERALEATQEAAEIYRRLADARPDAFLPDLGMSLNNLGSRYSELGQREKALEATREAAEIYRRLADARPDAFLHDLAGSLNNLGNRCSELGQREEALEATRQAAEIYRRLADARPDAFLPDLGMSLNNLGSRYSELGQREKALEATREAAEIYRRLADARPDAFLPDLAGSLNNLGNRYSELAQREKALVATREAAEIYRRLADARPDAFLPALAGSLNNLGNRYGELGQREKALEATREAAEIYRRLAEARPEAFLPDLAGSLNNLGNRYSESGQREKAIPLLEEALDTLWPFFERHPTAFWRTVLLIFRGLINTFESPDRQLRQHHRQHLEKLRNFVSAMDPPAKP